MGRFFLLATLALVLLSPISAQTPFDLRGIEYTATPNEDGESVEMEMRLAPLRNRDRIVVAVPLWRPGSYRYQNYGKRIRGIRAVDDEGLVRTVRPLDGRTWEVSTEGADALTISYSLPATNDAEPDLTPSIHLDGPATWLYLQEGVHYPVTVRFALPSKDWGVATGMRKDESLGRFTYRAPNYDVLADCPTILGAFEEHRFSQHGADFSVVLGGRVPDERDFDREGLVSAIEKIAQAHYDLFGSFPFEHYAFLYRLLPYPTGSGLEHLNSTTITWTANALPHTRKSLESITAHEFFHLWNVKRIRPYSLGPFDYASDARTKALWFSEGVTSYYADVLRRRAGLLDDGEFWDAQAKVIQTLESQSGFGKVSPERSSWTVWDRRRGDDTVSYYDQGQVIGLLLDLKIRLETENRRSLDDLFRFFDRWIDYPGDGFLDGDIERAIHALTGWECRPFFDRYVAGTVPPPFDPIFAEAGLQFRRLQTGEPDIGFALGQGNRLLVDQGSAAYKAGIRSGDRLLSFNGETVADVAGLRLASQGLAEGDRAKVRVKRDGRSPQTYRIPITHFDRTGLELRPYPELTPLQEAVQRGILDGTPGHPRR